jgi:hypothetical protein
MLAADVKKIEPAKYVAAATVGDSEVARLSGTPTAKHAEPIANSHPIQRVARSDGVGTGVIVDSLGACPSGARLGYRGVT